MYQPKFKIGNLVRFANFEKFTNEEFIVAGYEFDDDEREMLDYVNLKCVTSKIPMQIGQYVGQLELVPEMPSSKFSFTFLHNLA